MVHCLLRVAVVAVVLLQLLPDTSLAEPSFYSARYGKRATGTQLTVKSRSGPGFYANRYGRSGQLTPRSSRFIPGSRYGKRSGLSAAEESDEQSPPSLLIGESTFCLLLQQPDLYRCTRVTPSSSSEESE